MRPRWRTKVSTKTMCSTGNSLGLNQTATALAVGLLAYHAMGLDGPLPPETSLNYLQTEPSLRVELVAAEPMVVDPVAVAWDERGRMFVVEDRGYPLGPGKDEKPLGQIVLLEDTDGDGKYDKRTVFADSLTFPNGVMPWNGGVYVTCAPYLYYFKDTNSDGVADVRQTVFQGFQDLSTTQLRVSHPTLGIDNWVYLTSGLTAAKVISSALPDRAPVFLNRMDGRFRPGTDEIEPTAGTAQFGQTFDAFGRRFICSNRNHIQHVVMQQRYLRRNPQLSFSQLVEDIPDHGAACKLYPLSANIVTAAWHGGYVTSACGVTIYNGTALPDEYRGNSFTCEPAGNLVHRDVLVADGVTFVAKRAYPTNEFLASPDNWFRPVNLAVGPDGALYVCDMYRKTIEHPEYLPEATRKLTDFESGKGMGRIYRVVAAASDASEKSQKRKSVVSSQWSVAGKRKFDLGNASVKELCAQLENPNVWWRMTAHRLLLERRSLNAVPVLERLAKYSKQPEARVHALRTLEGLGELTDDVLGVALKDPKAAVREHAIQLAEPRIAGSPAWGARLLRLADDPDGRVRFQCALSLGDFNNDLILQPLLKIVERDMDSKWSRAAVLSGIKGREGIFLHQLLGPVTLAARMSPAGRRDSSSQAAIVRDHPDSFVQLMGELARSLPASGLVPEELLCSTNPADLPWQIAALSGLPSSTRHTLATAPTDSRARVDSIFARASDLALDARQSLSARLAAVTLLGQTGSLAHRRTLERLIEPQQPSELQTAAVRALAQYAGPEFGRSFVTRVRWSGYAPAVRDVVLTILTANTNTLDTLFTAIETGDVPAWTVSAERRNQLMHHKDAAFRARAEKLFQDLMPGDRMKVYEETKSVLTLKGDGGNGHAVFQKNCVSCHTFAGEGHTVGPDLTGIRNQPAEVLLLHIIVPEYEVMPIYTAYNVETTSGESYTGLLAADTPGAITLRMAQGVEQPIPRSGITSMVPSRLSLMPQELEKTMTKQELADLLAFLKGQ